MRAGRLSLRIEGMRCSACESRVEKILLSSAAITSARAFHASSRADALLNGNTPDWQDLAAKLGEAGYSLVLPDGKARASGLRGLRPALIPLSILFTAILVWLILRLAGIDPFLLLPRIDASLSLGAVFVAGLLTGFHCLAMCGAINLRASTAPASEKGPPPLGARLSRPLLYQAGRILSYAAIGAFAGGLGSFFSPSPLFRGIFLALCAVLMALMGLGMLGLLPAFLSHLAPRLPSGLSKLAAGGGSPFAMGLLNGLMPCGPLQAMQLYALSTGSALRGALALAIFGLGTLPVFLGFGALFALGSRKASAKAIRMIGAVLVIFLAFGMGLRAATALGIDASLPAAPSPLTAKAASSAPPAEVRDGKQYATVEVGPSSYSPIVLRAGMPAVVDFQAAEEDLNGCNEAIVIPALGIEKKFQPGHNLVEFTPAKAGRIAYSCWMDMISGRITVLPAQGRGDGK